MATTYTQHHLTLPSLGRGSHLITDHIVSSLPQISGIKCGLLHLFLQHTSCALSMNENWDDDVRADMSDALDGMVKEDKGALEKRVAWKEERFTWGHQSTYQVVSDRRERERTNIKWKTRHRDLAGHLVSGISEYEAEEEGPGYDTRGEDVRDLRHETRKKSNKDKATRNQA
ncbi:hypothetical protein HO133_005519 [Letharia lupina]|uniref:Uncharacterized protein n=1 Tax=Letharia lupina TaxID=560253 RepID=A0A8H6F8D6_9LECA|nr:uncharacterized protein HO133_005519 [Letharia lupina]KAF6218975.1 hypothetical protein HO133_005519 [Letharia lupina]